MAQQLTVTDWVGILSTFASVAVAVIGFAGLLTVFRSANEPLSRSDIVNIRILLMFGFAGLIFALLPLPFAHWNPSRTWPPLTVVMGLFLLVWPIVSPMWNRSRGHRPKRVRLFWFILGAKVVLGIWLVTVGLTGTPDGSSYVVGVAWCLLVAIVTFVAQVFAMLEVKPD